MSDRKSAIRSFLSEYMNHQDISDEQDIFSTGFVDSMFAMQLVQFLEQEFDITIKDEDLEIENFNTIAHMDQFVEEKTSSVTS